jgi:hypothetical protein
MESNSVRVRKEKDFAYASAFTRFNNVVQTQGVALGCYLPTPSA